MAFFRCMNTIRRSFGTAAISVEKNTLSKLRKSTGFSFSKCKEALQKHDNDIVLAEKWLRSEAQAHGWEKATKVQGRATGQGLISVIAEPGNALICEINCETDFVSRNKKFHTLTQKITQNVLNNLKVGSVNNLIEKASMTGEDFSKLLLSDSRSIQDEIALTIGELGENIKTRRAMHFKTSPSIHLSGFTHPAPESSNDIYFGKYGAIVAFRSTNSKPPLSLSEIGRRLCQHIIGMNPKEIGSMTEIPKKKAPVEVEKPVVKVESVKVDGEEAVEEEEEFVVSKNHEIDESALVNQEFLLDPDVTVREFLLQNSIEVVDFIRYECGEKSSSD